MNAQRFLWVAWPAFLAACGMEFLVFALVDPTSLHWGDQALGWSRQAVYTASFFTFWIVAGAACAMTTLLRMTPDQINECPFDPDSRPLGCPGRE